jgi:hypothetical protein
MISFNIVRAHLEPMAQAVRFYIAKETRFTQLADRQQLTEEGVKDVTIRRGEALEPSFSATIEAVQELFESLWAQGFRSVHDKGNSDKLDAARREHIDDLRKAAKLDTHPAPRR